MPSTLTYPGVYVEEVPSPVHTISGVATAVAALVGRARRGPVNKPIRIHSFADFERSFGALWDQSELGYAVQQYFQNGGTDAYVVRAITQTDLSNFQTNPARINLPGPSGALTIAAANPGQWFKYITLVVDDKTRLPRDTSEFNLFVNLNSIDPLTGVSNVVATETFRNVSIKSASPGFITTALANGSKFVATFGTIPTSPPANTSAPVPYTGLGQAVDGGPLTPTDLTSAATLESKKQGIYALEGADLFTLLILPPHSPAEGTIDHPGQVWQEALSYLNNYQRRAMLVIDPPSIWDDKDKALAGLNSGLPAPRTKDTVAYFPWLRYPDPLVNSQPRLFAPAATAAGVMARIDAQRGVWKAPAGEEARLAGVTDLGVNLNDRDHGDLNVLGLNCARTFPITGTVMWGARTLDGADSQASEWKYVPVRRTALFIEESLYRGTKWVVFEPNDEPLWSSIRLNVGAFMRSLFRQGAFQGATPREAYFVKCDNDTTTQDDINRGIVNILVGFAPLKPAEFVILKISQITGNIET